MRYIVAAALIVPIFFLGCGGGDDSEGGLTRTNDYETRALTLSSIGGSYSLLADEGLNFTITPSVAADFSVYFYSNEGNLSIEHIEMDADGAYICSSSSFTRSCTFENSDTGEEYTFSLANRSNNPLHFKLVAYQQSLSEGSAVTPVGISEDNYYSGQAGLDASYYSFTKSGNGRVEITVKETDTMTDSPENIAWQLTLNSSAVNVTDTDGNTSTTCRDAYSDENISCSTDSALSNGGVYQLKVENRGEAAFVKYKVLVTPL